MRIKDGFIVRQVAGENVIVGESIELVNFNRMIVLNDSALLVWNSLLGKDFEVSDAVAVLMKHYEVSEQTATADVNSLLEGWKNNGLME